MSDSTIPASVRRDVPLLLKKRKTSAPNNDLRPGLSKIKTVAKDLPELLSGTENSKVLAQIAAHYGADVSLPQRQSMLRYTGARSDVVAIRDKLLNSLIRLNADDVDHKYPRDVREVLKLAAHEQSQWDDALRELANYFSIHMQESGEILHEVRNRYANLFSKIPKTVLGLHQQLQAQKYISERLCAELNKVRQDLAQLSQSLRALKIKTRKRHVDQDPKLMEEYHKMYSMQRVRLERALEETNQDRNLWIEAATNLALRVAQEHGLPDVSVLQKAEFCRYRATTQVISLLSESNEGHMQRILNCMHSWMKRILSKVHKISIEDLKCKNILQTTSHEVQGVLSALGPLINKQEKAIKVSDFLPRTYSNENQGFRGSQESIRTTESHDADAKLLKITDFDIKELCLGIKKWSDSVSSISLRYTSSSGELIVRELESINQEMDKWYTTSSKFLNENNKNTYSTGFRKLERLIFNNKIDLEHWISKLNTRVAGDEAVVSRLISLQTSMDDQLNFLTCRDHHAFTNQEKDDIFSKLNAWKEWVDVLIDCYNQIQDDKEEPKLNDRTELWAAKLRVQVDADIETMHLENLKLHHVVIKWLVDVLAKKHIDSWDSDLTKVQDLILEHNRMLNQKTSSIVAVGDDNKPLHLVIQHFCEVWHNSAQQILKVEKMHFKTQNNK